MMKFSSDDSISSKGSPDMREPVAIIGIGCRFPGDANNPDSFWKLLCDGVDALVQIPEDRWDLRTFYDPNPGVPGKTNVRFGGFVKNIDQFDADFFGISPREASRMDPQQRLLLEVAWEALEDGGQMLEKLAGGPTGVFVGLSSYDYALIQAGYRDREAIDVYTNTGGALSIAANRISYSFDFTGPSAAVDTACSSALSAVHMACRTLWKNECTTALAGGINIIITPGPYIGFSKLAMLSADGRCKAFDAKANGFVRSEGAGMVLLKPLSRALEDGDRIYATILSSVANQDGATSGLTVPSERSQARLVREACRQAGVDPHQIQYVEAHGTGTLVGDPIEARALGSVLGTGRSPENALAIGSVKTNIGHLEAGAGIAGLVKTALALQHRMIPPSLFFEEPNPDIPFDELRLRIPTSLEPWPESAGPNLAGVNAFGFGGSNAHVILEGPPRAVHSPLDPSQRLGVLPSDPTDRPQLDATDRLHSHTNGAPPDAASSGQPRLVPLSARSPAAVKALARSYQEFFGGQTNGTPVSLQDFLYTVCFRRTHHDHRAAIVTHSREELATQLTELADGERSDLVVTDRVVPNQETKLAFVCSGQGPQWWAMGRQLLEQEPVFRDMIHRCDALIRKLGASWSLVEELTADEEDSRIAETSIAQPAIFAIQVALAEVWRSWGIEPDVVIGHSVGEVAAAHLAGVLSLEDAVCVIYHRGRTMDLAPADGRMLAAAISVEEAEQLLVPYGDRVTVAAMNAPRSLTLSGEPGALEEISETLTEQQVFNKFLNVNYAFHSHHMDPVRDEVLSSLAEISPRDATLPLVSTVTGDWAEGPEMDADYWWQNVRSSVRFAEGVGRLLDDGANVFLEISPHQVLGSAVMECALDGGTKAKVLGSLKRHEEERAMMLRSLGALYCLGVPVDWNRQHGDKGNLMRLPTYPWQREHHWHEAQESMDARLGMRGMHPLLGRQLRQSTPIWGGNFNGNWQTWLPDHKVQGQIIVPGTAFIEMAVAAAKETFGAGPYVIEDLKLLKACFLAKDMSRTSETIYNEVDSSFNISSRLDAADQSWMHHVSGRLYFRPNDDREKLCAVHEVRGRCPDEIAGDDCYKAFGKIDLHYGPTFRGIERLWTGDREALGEIRVPQELESDLSNYTIHPAVLDACIQVMLGTIPKSHRERVAGQGVFLPVEMEEVRVYNRLGTRLWSHAQLTEINQQGLTASIQVVNENQQVVLEICGLRCQSVGVDGDTDRLEDLIYESKWKLKARDEAQPSCRQFGIAPPLTEIAEDMRSVVERLAGQGQKERYQGLSNVLSGLCAAYVVRALTKLGAEFEPGRRFTNKSLADKIGLDPIHRRLFDRYLNMLAEDGLLRKEDEDRRTHPKEFEETGRANPDETNGSVEVAYPTTEAETLESTPPDDARPLGEDAEWEVLRRPDYADPQKTWSTLLTENPAFFAEFTLIRRCGESLAEVLSGETNPLQLIFPDGSLDTAEHLYQDSPSVRFYNRLAQEAITRVVEHLPEDRPLRILEIGAGTGGLTSYLLPRLPADRTQYVFTDLSNHFFIKGAQKFAPFPFIEYKILDISQDPLEQEFSEHNFDIVIASQVLHATQDLTQTLTNVRKLMAGDGLLVLLEVVKPERWIDLVFGLTDGWWHFSDLELRPDYPLLTFHRWKELLEGLNFSEVVDASSTTRVEGFGSAVILGSAPALAEAEELPGQDEPSAEQLDDAESTEAEPLSPEPDTEAGHWLIFADAEGIGERLAEKLGETDQQCVLVYPNDEFQALGDGRFNVNPARSEDFEQLLQYLKDSERVALGGVVHLWSLDAPSNENLSTHALEELQRLGLQCVTNFVQAWEANVDDAAKLSLVTRGAVSVRGSGDELESISPPQTTIWGFGRVIYNEYPELDCRLVDLSPNTSDAEFSSLLEELTCNDGEEEVALRDRARYVHRWTHGSLENRSKATENGKAGGSSNQSQPFRLEVPRMGVLDRLKLRATSRIEPGEQQVEIEVMATALNFSDVMKCLGLYPGLPDGPVPLGIECAGRIAAVGPGVTEFQPGDEVVALAPFCFGAYTTTYAQMVVRKPERMTFEEAATLPIAFLTAQYALNYLGRLQPGERVLIHSAAGGVGLAAIQLARQAGAEVFATAGSPERRDFLRSIGVKHVMDSRSLLFADQIMEITEGEGVDVVLNSLSGPAIEKSLSVLGDYGRFLEIGKRDIYMNSRLGMRPFKKNVSFHAIDLDRALRNRPRLIAAQFQEVMGEAVTGNLHPLPHRVFSINNVTAAFRYMAQAKHLGKVVVSLQEEALSIAPGEVEPVELQCDATYLVTGGLGGFGLVVAEWMVERGARHLVLVGRRGIHSEESAAAVENLRRLGAEVNVIAADVSRPELVAGILREISESMPPLRGIVHAAMALEDCLLTKLDFDTVMRVLGPRMSGAWNLHTQTLGMPLDFFVCFSSMAGTFGLPGQGSYAASNTFLDALAFYRRSLGLPALTISWGFLRDVGYVARQENLGERFEGQGLKSFSPREAVWLLERLIATDPIHVGIKRIEWNRWRHLGLRSSTSNRFADLCDEDAGGGDGKDGLAIRKALLAAPESERKSILQDLLREKVANVLGADPEKVDLAKPLTDVGVDSLMAVELRNWIEGELRVKLPIVELMQGPTVDRLADVLLEQLVSSDETAPSSTSTATRADTTSAADETDVDQAPIEVDALSDEEVDAQLKSLLEQEAPAE